MIQKLLLFFITTLLGASFSLVSFATPENLFAEKVVVEKANRKLYLMREGKVWKSYTIALGDAPVGPKKQQGDEKTPEGIYKIDFRNPKSAYHLSLHISYPNSKDRQWAKEHGVSPGGDIFIHGFPNSWKGPDIPGVIDWTDGCIALSNSAIDEVWKLVRDGTEIEIKP